LFGGGYLFVMTTIDYISSFEKYIDSIILPKYPEIESFEVRLSKRKEWSFEKKDWNYVVEIIFIVDGTEQEFEDALRDDMYNMKKVFSVGDNITINFSIIVEGDMYGGDWYV
jgi:hypothetical protein